MLGRYFQGRITPDGAMVTRHDPPDFEGVTLPCRKYEWGPDAALAQLLAMDLIEMGVDWDLCADSVSNVAEQIVRRLPTEGEWRVTAQEIMRAMFKRDGR